MQTHRAHPNQPHHARRRNWLPLMLPKRPRFITLFTNSMQRLRKSCFTAGLSSKRDCSNQKQQSCSRVLPLNCKPNSTRNFSKTCTSLSLTIGGITAKPATNGKSTSETLTTCSSMPKHAENSLPSSARNPVAKNTQTLTRQNPPKKGGFSLVNNLEKLSVHWNGDRGAFVHSLRVIRLAVAGLDLRGASCISSPSTSLTMLASLEKSSSYARIVTP
jgi:hypothetical protein